MRRGASRCTEPFPVHLAEKRSWTCGWASRRMIRTVSSLSGNGYNAPIRGVRETRGVLMATPADPSEADRQAWLEEFAAAASRPLAVRLRYAFVWTHKPVFVVNGHPARLAGRFASGAL